jgi:serine protease AprX
MLEKLFCVKETIMSVKLSVKSNVRPTGNSWRVRGRRYVLALMALLLMLPLVGCARPVDTLPVQPEVLALARSQPQSMLPIIVQERWPSNAPEARVAELGGTVIQDLAVIHGFSAALPAAAIRRLAQEPAVRWISLDAPMRPAQAQEQQPAFVTWATQYEDLSSHAFYRTAYLTDSSLGPVGTYAISRRGASAFGGFTAEITEGYRIAKVEAVIVGFANRPIRMSALVSPQIDGVKIGDVLSADAAFAARTGYGNAGPVYVDVTGGRQWQWADFERDIKLVIDYTGLDWQDWLHIDAVGLRVWIEPGSDETGNAVTPDETPNTPIAADRQVNVYNNVIGVEALWSTDYQLQGNNVGVAVVDSGVEKTGDLAHLTGANANFNKGYHDSMDRYGHGTFVAAVLAGSGASSNGLHIGVAPRVRLINVRVSDDQGMATVSDVVAGLQWIYQNKETQNIRVVNLSLNSSVEASYLMDPLCAAVEFLWLNGIVVVVSAGNNGTATLYPPANDPFVITVGATDDLGTATTDDDAVAHFSGYGLTELGSPKPDLVAPGRNIIAYLPDNSTLRMSIEHASHRVTDDYFRMSGTSVSAPMVAGAAALLLQDEPALTPDQVKFRLLSTANKDWPGYDPARAGAGYVNAHAAVYGAGLDSANSDVAFSHLMLKSLLYAAWSSINWDSVDWNTIDWAAIDWSTVDLSAFDWSAIDWNSIDWSAIDSVIDWNAIDWSSVNWNSVNWNSVNWNSVNWNSVNWNSVNWNSVNWNSVNWNSVNWNSDYWEEEEGMTGAGADSIPAVRRLYQLLAEDAAANATNWVYLPTISR